MSSQGDSQKSHELTAYLPVFDLFLTHEMAILSKGYKPNNFESHNSLKLSSTNIQGHRSKFYWIWIFPWFQLSWYSCFMWDKFGWLNWFSQFLCEGFIFNLPLIRKDSVTHMHGLPCSLWQAFLLNGTYLQKNLWILSYLCFRLAFLHSVSCFFFVLITFFIFIHGFWCYFI